MSRYVLGHAANQDLDDIWNYIAQDSVTAADQWIDKLFEAFAAIAQNPGIGHLRPDLTDKPVLFWPVSAYLVLYRKAKGRVEIVAITQGARDIPSFLGNRQP